MTLNVGVTCGILRIPAIYQLPKAGHAGLRRNWNLPYNCHSAMLQLLSDVVPLHFDLQNVHLTC